MPHTIKYVVPLSDYEASIRFLCGVTKRYDFKVKMQDIELYLNCFSEPGVFEKARVSEDGQSIYWNEYVDIGCEELWRNGKEMKGPFDGLLTGTDVELLWHIDESTLRKALLSGKLREGVDAMKFGKQWIYSLKALTKVLGSWEKAGAKAEGKRSNKSRFK